MRSSSCSSRKAMVLVATAAGCLTTTNPGASAEVPQG